jgi:hypothetical protein
MHTKLWNEYSRGKRRWVGKSERQKQYRRNYRKDVEDIDSEVMHATKLGQKFFELRIFVNKAMKIQIFYKNF